MKIILSVLFLVAGSLTANAEVPSDSLATYSFGACNWWSNVSTNSGNIYGCQNYPQRIDVPNARDLVRILNLYEEKITQLEARIKTLEDASNTK